MPKGAPARHAKLFFGVNQQTVGPFEQALHGVRRVQPRRVVPSMTDQIQQVAVVGAGYMGGGIAQTLAMAGLDVVIVDADPALTSRHLDRLYREAEDFEGQGLFDAGSADLVQANLRAADSLPDAVAEADLIEEAVLELPEIKGPVLKD